MGANFTESCPERAELLLLANGNMSNGRSIEIEEHLSTCENCAATMDGFRPDDELIALLRSGIASELELDSAAANRLIEQLRDLPICMADTDKPQQTRKFHASSVDRVSYPDLRSAQVEGELGCLGKYRVVRTLGRGNMGIVFEAIDPQLKRQVALKILSSNGEPSDTMRKRFVREAQAIASVKHDNIVSIYEVGEDNGVPFIAMELLQGETLETCLRREGKLSVQSTIRLAKQIASGLEAAHREKLIHRDIKPSNIWLEADSKRRDSATTRESDPRAKLLDFGLALRETQSEAISGRVLVGTVGYLAPELVQGKTADEKSDLFSFGCVLYQIVTGNHPFPGSDALTVLFALATRDPLPIVDPSIPAGLRQLIASLLDKQPDRRIPTASAVKIQLDQIEIAQEQPKRKAARKPMFAAVLATATLLLLSAMAAVVVQFTSDTGQLMVQSNQAPVRIIVERDGKRQLEATLSANARQQFGLDSGDYQIELEEQTPVGRHAKIQLTIARGRPAALDVKDVEFDESTQTAPPAGPIVSEPAHVESIIGDGRLRHWNWITSLAMSADGRRLMSGSWDCTAKVWDTQTGDEIHTFSGHEYQVVDVDIHPERPLYVTTGADNLIKIWDETSTAVLSIPTNQTVRTVRFTPDGDHVLGMSSQSLYRWNIADGKLDWTVSVNDTSEQASSGFDVSGSRIANRSDDGFEIRDTSTGEVIEMVAFNDKSVSAVRFLADGVTLAIGTARPSAVIRLFDHKLDQIAEFSHDNDLENVVGISSSPNGRKIAVIFGADYSMTSDELTPRTVVTWDLDEKTKGVSIEPRIYNTGYFDAVFSIDGAELYTAGNDGTIRVCSTETGKDSGRLGQMPYIYSADLSDDGEFIAHGDYDGRLSLLTTATRKVTKVIDAHQDLVFDVAIHPNNSEIVTSSTDSTIRRWTRGGEETATINHYAAGLSFGANGNVLVAGGRWYEHEVKAWDATTLRHIDFARDNSPIRATSFAVSESGELLVTGAADGTVSVWDLSLLDVKCKLPFPSHHDILGANAVAISPDDQSVIVAYGQAPSDHGETWIWDVGTGKRIASLSGYHRLVASLAVSPDGKTIVTGGWYDGTVRLWSMAGKPLRNFTLGPPASSVRKLLYVGDGTRAAAVGSDGRIHILRVSD